MSRYEYLELFQSPLDFEITRVECIFIYTYTKAYMDQIALVGGGGGGGSTALRLWILRPFFHDSDQLYRRLETITQTADSI